MRQFCVTDSTAPQEQSDNSCRSVQSGRNGNGRRKGRRHSLGWLGNREQRQQRTAQGTDQRRRGRKRRGRCVDHRRHRLAGLEHSRTDRSSGISCLVRLVAHGPPPPPGRGGVDGPYRVHGRRASSRVCICWLRTVLCRRGPRRGIFSTMTATGGRMSNRDHSP